MKPFNLAEALEGKPLVTRAGQPAYGFKRLYNPDGTFIYPYSVYFYTEKDRMSYSPKGKCFIDSESPADLFMVEEEDEAI